jgi:hypothetical protein
MPDQDPQDQAPARRKRAFLAAFRISGNVSTAADAAEVHRSSHYEWMQTDPDYAVAFDHAQGEAADRLEQEARRRAIEGVRRPVLHQGAQVKIIDPETNQETLLWEHAYSDTLLIFLLKGARPEKFRDNVKLEQQVSGGLAVKVDEEIPDWLRRRTNASQSGDDAGTTG